MSTSFPTDEDICRVCRSQGTSEQPLFYPCKCNGSIRYIHESCLKEWLTRSERTYCELCRHEYSFVPGDLQSTINLYLRERFNCDINFLFSV
jgi:E3 ubiquitin-protein ligase DOA10